MDKISQYRRWFEYDAWANREVLVNLKQIENPPARALKFLAHILAAETLWLERMKGEAQSMAVWPELTLPQCEVLLEKTILSWKDFLVALGAEEFAQNIAYTNTKGEGFRSPVDDILTHVLMHAAYHRGQIATEVRSAGHTPAYTDFIHAARGKALSR